jgi:hypothetical protein
MQSISVFIHRGFLFNPPPRACTDYSHCRLVVVMYCVGEEVIIQKCFCAFRERVVTGEGRIDCHYYDLTSCNRKVLGSGLVQASGYLDYGFPWASSVLHASAGHSTTYIQLRIVMTAFFSIRVMYTIMATMRNRQVGLTDLLPFSLDF